MCAGGVIFSPAAAADSDVKSIVPKDKLFYKLRFYYNQDKDVLRLDDFSATRGPSVTVIYGGCLGALPDPPNMYYVNLISQSDEIIIKKQSVGNLIEMRFVDYPFNEEGKREGEVIFLRAGIVNICVPYNTNGRRIDLYKSENNTRILSIDVSRFTGKNFIRNPDGPGLLMLPESNAHYTTQLLGESFEKEAKTQSFIRVITDFISRHWGKILAGAVIFLLIILVFREIQKSRIEV